MISAETFPRDCSLSFSVTALSPAPTLNPNTAAGEVRAAAFQAPLIDPHRFPVVPGTLYNFNQRQFTVRQTSDPALLVRFCSSAASLNRIAAETHPEAATETYPEAARAADRVVACVLPLHAVPESWTDPALRDCFPACLLGYFLGYFLGCSPGRAIGFPSSFLQC
jgi:hypothetical protein